MDLWLFGYGSLIWRPDFAFRERRPARVHGWARRFWQGSHDHRGVPGAPGRVVTLVREPGAACDGMAYLIERRVAEEAFAYLDHREKDGYARHEVTLAFRDGSSTRGLVYIATRDNHAYLGPAPPDEMAAHIARSHGPSGSNAEYLLQLAGALREIGAEDEHVFALERRVRAGPSPAGAATGRANTRLKL